MSTTLSLPILKDLIPDGIEYGASLLVEFEPRSIWYETSLTIAARALKNGIPTEYHTFQHSPEEIRKALARFGLNAIELHPPSGIVDSYTPQTGLGASEPKDEWGRSLSISNWSIGVAKIIKTASGADKETVARERRLHIDDNISILLQYNQEKDFIDFYRTRMIPLARVTEMTALVGMLTEVASDSFYRKFEAVCDGILEFKTEDKEGRIEQFVRVSAMRDKSYESGWRRLRLLDNEVALAD